MTASSAPAEVVRDTLLEYAERGVFRGFDHGTDPGAGGDEGGDEDPASSFRFFWLGPRPFHLRLSSDGRVLTVQEPFPALAEHPDVRSAVEGMIDERLVPAPESLAPTTEEVAPARESSGGSSLPPHRRIEREKASVELARASNPRGEDSFDLVITIRNGHQEYAVRKVLNLVHEIWVHLQDRHQRYLWEEFQAPME